MYHDDSTTPRAQEPVSAESVNLIPLDSSLKNQGDLQVRSMDDNSATPETSKQTSGDFIFRQQPALQSDETSENSDGELDGDQSTYLGHTNPEGFFLEVESPNAPRTGSDTVGVWLPRRTYEQVKKGAKVGSTYNNIQQQISFSHDPFVSKVLLPYLTDQGMRLIPDFESYNALRAIYERDVHPVFPILPFETMPQWNGVSELSPTRVLLMQSLCLAVAANPSAQSHLRLPSTGSSLLSPKDFAANTSKALLLSRDLVGRHSRVTSIRALSTLSLFSQLSEDDHSSAEYCARAVSYVQTLQIHLSTSRFRKDHHAVTRLFLCVWALDRLNAAFHGRPVLLHSRDFGRDMKATIAEQRPPFRLFLAVVELLDNIISLYRPMPDPSSQDAATLFPSFEDMVVSSGAVKTSAHLTATLETLYHAVAMLSCRFDSLEDPDRSSASYLRQSLSASRLISLVGTEFENNLSIFPFVPYSISLCLRVSYRELRTSKATIHRSRAKTQLEAACKLLSKHIDTFAFAERMVKLAEKTIEEMNKVTTSMVQAQDQSIRQNPATANQGADDLGVFLDNVTGPLESHSHGNGIPSNKSPQQDLQFSHSDFNFERFDEMNVFDYFDPDFNLGAIDAALAQNISADALPDLDFASDFGFTPVDMRLEDAMGVS